MIPIFICIKNEQQLTHIQSIISKYIMIEELDMYIELVTQKSQQFIDNIKQGHHICGIYFIGMEPHGLTLAQQIRQYDVLGKMIYIGGEQQDFYQVLTSQCEVLDYLIESDKQLQHNIIRCLKIAHARLSISKTQHQETFLPIKLGHYIKHLALDEIMFFESSTMPHKITAQLVVDKIDFYYLMKNLEMEDKGFYRCHRSYIVNIKNIIAINKKARSITMRNGSVCYFSEKYKKRLLNSVTLL